MSLLDKYYSYRFVYLLTQRWEDTDAFKFGIIDKDGSFIKKISELVSHEEKNSVNKFNILVWNIKRLLEKVPFSKSILGKFVTALALLKEENNLSEEQILSLISEHYPNNSLVENFCSGVDMTDRRLGDKPERRKQLPEEEYFGGDRVFVVSDEYFQKSKFGKNKYSKYKKFVGEDETGQRIREYGRTYPERGIVLKNSHGAMLYLRKRK